MQNKSTQRPKFITGYRANLVRMRVVMLFLAMVIKIKPNLLSAWKEVQRMRRKREKFQGNHKLKKFVKSGKRFHWVTDNFGVPSKNLNEHIENEVMNNPDEKIETEIHPLQTVIWGITNRCALSCEHCYDWDNLNTKETLDLNQLRFILGKIKKQGIRHVQLSGGEPLARFDDLTALIGQSSETFDFWLLTSGFGLTSEKAVALKSAGMIGVIISLDHWEENKHNRFRNNNDSFNWVKKAVENSLDAGLLVSLSLCATREFTNKTNVLKYAALGREWGVHFIRILEARKIGNYATKDVKLSEEQITLLADWSIKLNSDRAYKDYPIMINYGFHQRRMGCQGAAKKYFYIDAKGEIHACPFCQGSVGNALEMELDEAISKLRKKGCHKFKSVLHANQPINNQKNHHKQIQEVQFIK